MTPTSRRVLGTIMWLGITTLCGAVLSLAGLYLYLDPQIPSARSYRNVELETPLRVYASDGALIAEYGERRLIPVTLADVPADFVNAVLNTEDKRFFEHSGIDFISLLNDTFQLIVYREIRGGASTITMQLARNVSFSLEQTFIRKFKEMLLALKLERELSKEEILELYINVVPFGKGAYGAEAAAQTYYGKTLKELELAQLAMLAGIPKAPTAGNPINGPERALDRRNVVLERMLEQASISQEQHDRAVAKPITASIYARPLDVPSPYPAELIRQELTARYDDLYSGGYEIHTTIDSRLQAKAIASVRQGLIDYDRRHGYRGPEANVAAEDPANAYPEYLAALDDLGVVGGLVPAVVVDVADEHFDALLPSNIVKRIPFEALAWARSYINENQRGPAPKIASDVVAVGDVIRLRYRAEPLEQETQEDQQEAVERWEFAQVPAIQGALVSIDPETGGIVAMVGGFDFAANQFNNASQAARQPGSGFKPFVYAAALNSGITPATLFLDAPLVFEDALLETQYRPRNDNARYNGETRLREALYRSINLVSIRVLQEVGAGNVLNFARNNLGFDIATFPRNTQLAIGGGTMAVTPIDMARSYALFANGGYLVQPHLLRYVKNRKGDIIYQNVKPAVCRSCDSDANDAEPSEDVATVAADIDIDMAEAEAEAEGELAENSDAITTGATSEDEDSSSTASAVIEELIPAPPAPAILDGRVAYIMHTMLQDVIRRGTGTKARVMGRGDIAGKTGTTDEAADTWFNGYNPALATTVWVGFSDYRPLGRREYGSTTPLPIWIDYMTSALAGSDEAYPKQPPGIVTMKIDTETGEPTPPGQPGSAFEYFLAEHAPPPASNSVRDIAPSYDEVDVDEIVVPDDLF
ncbi:MAG: PBP1A family penicillin-binding protein [Pseudomonadaceae bacterium]|nr:PBP1A family penicillin-binding protein [Pseudomonadaceae bacterium]